MQPPPTITTSAVRFILVLLPRRRGFRVPRSGSRVGVPAVQRSGFGVRGSGFGAPLASARMIAQRYQDLDCWQLSNELKQRVYAFIASRRIERFEFCDQIGAQRVVRHGRLLKVRPIMEFAAIAHGNAKPSRRRARLEYIRRGARPLQAGRPSIGAVQAASVSACKHGREPEPQNPEPGTSRTRTRNQERTLNPEPGTLNPVRYDP